MGKAKFHFELNSAGVRELLKSPYIASCCRSAAEEIAARAGDGYQATDTYIGRNRVNVSVEAATSKAARDNLKNNTLLKAVHR